MPTKDATVKNVECNGTTSACTVRDRMIAYHGTVDNARPLGKPSLCSDAPLAPPLLLKRLLQNGDLTVAGGVNVEFSGSLQRIRIEEDDSVHLAVRRGNAQLGTKLGVRSLSRPQTMLAGQSEGTGFAVDRGDLPERGAAVDEGIIIDDGADDARVVEDDGSVRSSNELWVGGRTGQTLGVVLGIAAMHSIGEEVANGCEEARAVRGSSSNIVIIEGTGR